MKVGNRKIHFEHNQSGVALVFVLWIIVLLSVIGVSHSRNVRLEMQIARHLLDNAQAKAMAEAGLNRAIMELFNSDQATRWPYNGELNYMDFDGGVVKVMIRNTAGLVDINTASPDTLKKLIALVDLESTKQQELVDAILDWRDTDDLRRLNGAEDAEYKQAGLPYGTPDQPFFSIGELRYVLGMDTDIYNALSPYITVYSGLSAINQNFAPVELSSLSGNTGDQTFQDVAPDIQYSENGTMGSTASPGTMLQGMASKVFHISVWATAESGASAGLEVDVDISGKGNKHYSIVSWQESSQG